jgi:hypothetical protein
VCAPALPLAPAGATASLPAARSASCTHEATEDGFGRELSH